jgi:hypothetical protein
VESEKEGRVEAEGSEKTAANESTGRETIAVSNPSPCAACKHPEPEPATYQGASADGSKVFFTTEQELLHEDEDVANGRGGGNDLYAYEELGKPTGHLAQLSKGNCETTEKETTEKVIVKESSTCGSGAEVQGVVRSSSDGSHVYFVAKGRLTLAPSAGGPQSCGPAKDIQNAGHCAEQGEENLYAVDTNSGKVKFVATLQSSEAERAVTDEALWGADVGTCGGVLNKSQGPVACDTNVERAARKAQTTPDGEFLVFSSFVKLAGAPNGALPTRAVYRYDFQSGALTWISHDVPGFHPSNEECEAEFVKNKEEVKGKEAHANTFCSSEVAGVEGRTIGGMADANDYGRAISNNEEGKHDGEDIIFSTRAKLAPQDEGVRLSNVYLWHCSSPCEHPQTEGTVAMISPGHAAGSANEERGTPGYSSMSASGSDIFFTTPTELVGQDKDELTDVYDARIDGGFPAPTASAGCFPGCQPGSAEQSQLEGVFSAALPASQLPTGGANVSTVTNLTPSITLHGAKLKGNSVVATFRTSEAGSVTLSGSGVKTATKAVAGGSGQVTLALSSAGKFAKSRHRTSKIEALLRVGLYSGHASITLRL